MKTITIDEILSTPPCAEYPSEVIMQIAESLAADKQQWTALEILAREDVSADHRLWLVHRKELVDTPILHEAACRYAERVVEMADKPQILIDLLELKRRWVQGKVSSEDLASARDSISHPPIEDDLIYASVFEAVGDDACRSAQKSSDFSVWAVADMEAGGMTGYVNWGIVWGNEIKEHVNILRKLLEGIES
jgi:hypothetical protein